MSTAESVVIANDVVTVLKNASAGTFSMPFNTIRGYAPVVDVEQLQRVRVSVIPSSRASVFTARNTQENDTDIQLAVQMKLRSPESNDEIDPLTGLVDEIANYMAVPVRRNLTGTLGTASLSSGAHLMVVNNDPLYNPDHLRNLQVFTSILTLSYKATRIIG